MTYPRILMTTAEYRAVELEDGGDIVIETASTDSMRNTVWSRVDTLTSRWTRGEGRPWLRDLIRSGVREP